MTFKIDLGNWTEYRPDASLDLPSSSRIANNWNLSSIETYHISYYAQVGTFPHTAASPWSTWIAVTAGTYSTSLDGDSAATFTTCLTIDTPTDLADCYCYFKHDSVGTNWYDNINNAEGYIIKARLKVIDGGTQESQRIDINDGTYYYYILFLTNRIAVGSTTYSMDTTDDYHIYDARVYGTNIKLYIDDILRLNGSLATTTSNKILRWGDMVAGANYGGNVAWDYIRYKTSREAIAEVIADSDVDSGYILDIDTSIDIGDIKYFAQSGGTSPFILNVDNVRGYTIEAKLKIINTDAVAGQAIYFYDGTYSEYLYFKTNAISLAFVTNTYPMDTTDAYHIYRIARKGTNVKIYADGVLRITATTDTVNISKYIYFGEPGGGNWGGQTKWAYIKYRTDGAFPPSEDISTGWVYDKFDISDSRRMSRYNIIKSDNNIIPKGNAEPTKISISGTLVGSCFDSFKETIRRLKRMFYAGEQKIYLDENQFIKGLNSGFTLKPINKTFAEYSIPFECQYPYWQKIWANYAFTAPAHAVSFLLQNNGDVDIPLRIIVTGAATGTITNFTIDNLTMKQKGKYIGSVSATQELFIDSGYFDYNKFSVMIGTGSYFSSYEGDLLKLSPGSNSIMFSTNVDGALAGTLEFYWREANLL